MSMNYTWKITGLKRLNSPNIKNIVVQTYWKKIGTDSDGNIGEFSGATPFESSSVNVDEFIEYEDLTEEMVLEWIKGIVVGSYEEHVNQQIQKQIDQKINPLIETNNEFPWGTLQPEPPTPEFTPRP